MQTLTNGTRGLSLLMQVNADRLLFVTAIAGALWAGAFLSSL